jgi:hypothetical protein
MKHLNLNIDDCALNIQLDSVAAPKIKLQSISNTSNTGKFSSVKGENLGGTSKAKMKLPQILISEDMVNVKDSEELAGVDNYKQLLKPLSPNKIEALSIGLDHNFNNLSENSDLVCNRYSHNNGASLQTTPKEPAPLGIRFVGKPGVNFLTASKKKDSLVNQLDWLPKDLEKKIERKIKPDSGDLKNRRFNFDNLEKQFTPKMSSLGGQNNFFKFDAQLLNLGDPKRSNPYVSMSCKNGVSYSKLSKPIESNTQKQFRSNKNSQKHIDVKANCRTPKSNFNVCSSPKVSALTNSIKKSHGVLNSNKNLHSSKLPTQFSANQNITEKRKKPILSLDINNVNAQSDCEDHQQVNAKPQNTSKLNAKPVARNLTTDSDIDQEDKTAVSKRDQRVSFEKPHTKFSKHQPLNLVIEEIENETTMQNSVVHSLQPEVPIIRKEATDSKTERIIRDQKFKTDNYKRMLESKAIELRNLQQKFDEISEQNIIINENLLVQRDLTEFYKARAFNLEHQLQKLSGSEPLALENKSQIRKFLTLAEPEIPISTCSQPVSPSNKALPNEQYNKSLTPSSVRNNPPGFVNTPHPSYFKFDNFGCQPLPTTKASEKRPPFGFSKNANNEVYWSQAANSEMPKIHQINTITNNININIKESITKSNNDNNSQRQSINKPGPEAKSRVRENINAFTPKNGAKSGNRFEHKVLIGEFSIKESNRNLNLELHKFRTNFVKNAGANPKPLQTNLRDLVNPPNGKSNTSCFYSKTNTQSKTKNGLGFMVSLKDSPHKKSRKTLE